MSFLKPCSALLIFGLVPLSSSALSAWDDSQTEALLKKMEAAYAAIEDYQTLVEVLSFEEQDRPEREEFLYSFKKPNHIRMDFLTPHRGMIVVYPDPKGKVVIRRGGLGRHFPLRLSPQSFLLRNAAGQRIDQTDLGLLIRNIGQSLTGGRSGQVEAARQNGALRLRVLAQDHFQKAAETLYEFHIDESLRLPVRVDEMTPEGRPKRKIFFRRFKTNLGLADSFFQLDQEKQ